MFERVAHYNTIPPPPGPSQTIRGLRNHLRNSITPLPSVSSQSSEGDGISATLRPPTPTVRDVETKRLREEALQLQEEQEERELKQHRKVSVVSVDGCDHAM